MGPSELRTGRIEPASSGTLGSGKWLRQVARTLSAVPQIRVMLLLRPPPRPPENGKGGSANARRPEFPRPGLLVGSRSARTAPAEPAPRETAFIDVQSSAGRLGSPKPVAARGSAARREEGQSLNGVGVLELEQALLGRRAARRREAAEAIAACQDAMAGDDHGYRVAAHGLADGAGGARHPECVGERAVAGGFAPGEQPDLCIEREMEWRPMAEIEVYAGEVGGCASEVSPELRDRPGDGFRQLPGPGTASGRGEPALGLCEVGAGIAPVPELLEAGVTVGLGSDGYVNDFYEVVRATFLIHKAHKQDPRVMPAPLVWHLATEGGALALGWLRAHTGSARGLVFAPGGVPPSGAAALAEAGFSQVLRFDGGHA